MSVYRVWAVRVLCILSAVLLMLRAIYCGVQELRDVPVEPTWAWGALAYTAGAILMAEASDRYGRK